MSQAGDPASEESACNSDQTSPRDFVIITAWKLLFEVTKCAWMATKCNTMANVSLVRHFPLIDYSLFM